MADEESGVEGSQDGGEDPDVQEVRKWGKVVMVAVLVVVGFQTVAEEINGGEATGSLQGIGRWLDDVKGADTAEGGDNGNEISIYLMSDGDIAEWGPANLTHVVDEAMRYWTDRGYNITMTDFRPDVRIHFVAKVGYGALGWHGGSYILVGLGDTKCDGNWTQFSFAYVRDILIHEFGHAVGLEHSEDAHDVMSVPHNGKQYAEPCVMEASLKRSYGEVAWTVMNVSEVGMATVAVTTGGDMMRACIGQGESSQVCEEGVTPLLTYRASPGDLDVSFECLEPGVRCHFSYRVLWEGDSWRS